MTRCQECQCSGRLRSLPCSVWLACARPRQCGWLVGPGDAGGVILGLSARLLFCMSPCQVGHAKQMHDISISTFYLHHFMQGKQGCKVSAMQGVRFTAVSHKWRWPCACWATKMVDCNARMHGGCNHLCHH
jgi:hypothetical protein